MDVTKAPPPADITSPGVGTATNAAAASQSSAVGASTASNISTAVGAVADRVDIQPLDVAAALQILVAEVRAELPLPGASLPGPTPQVNAFPARQEAEIVLSEMTEARAFAPASADATASPSPSSQPAGLALLESRAIPLSPWIAAELSGPPALLGAGASESPTLEPMPETPGLAGPAGVGAAVGVTAGALGAEPPAPSPSFAATPPEPLPPQTPSGMGPPSIGPPRIVPPRVGPPGIVPSGSSDGDVGAALTPEPSSRSGLSVTALPEIQASLDLDPLEPLLMPPGARLAMPSALTLLSSPAQASPVLMRMFLQSVPQGADNPAAWSAAVKQLEVTLQSALDRAVATVEQWHDVPQVVVDAARETRGLVMTQLAEEPPGPLWLRPEWLWLSPQMERFRRRRRLARRSLSDPDLWPLREDDGRRAEPTERKEEG